ncbi:hypothetical protein [Sphingomonas bacterium]|uniref:hypothetical protein n=1 Tax=Sphingomonas bacterium TaxID=1895847 RepID=UPI001577725B|nr:hypothetical protein [Sphingomonas bacterium]
MSGGRKGRDDAGSLSIDGAYLREQAHEAVKLFFAPLAGVYRAINDQPAVRSDERA